jgi:hypothetical protein
VVIPVILVSPDTCNLDIGVIPSPTLPVPGLITKELVVYTTSVAAGELLVSTNVIK